MSTTYCICVTHNTANDSQLPLGGLELYGSIPELHAQLVDWGYTGPVITVYDDHGSKIGWVSGTSWSAQP